MSTRRYFASTFLALAAAAAAAFWWQGPPAHAAVAWNSATVPITGVVTGRPESVAFSGQAQIQTRLALDPEDARRAKIVLHIDLSGVAGVGALTSATYDVEAHEIVFRGLAPSDLVKITFAFHARGTRATEASRTGVASFALSFDTANGVITAARASIASPEF